MHESHLAFVNRVNRPGTKLLFHVVVYSVLDGFVSVIVDAKTISHPKRFAAAVLAKTMVYFWPAKYNRRGGVGSWRDDVEMISSRV